jgi:hypothetical protein
MRPRGSYGEVAEALRTAAAQAPGTVRDLAQRACVGYDVARYTASRLVDAGTLVVQVPQRPAVLAAAPAGATGAEPLVTVMRSFWERPAVNV